MKSSPLDVLKSAILLERRGKAFYQKVATEAKSEPVREFFEMMAAEEDRHIEVLSKQFQFFQTNNAFLPDSFEKTDTSKLASSILSQELKDKIGAAGFEAAAVAAAMSMEERAIRLYSGRAGQADDPAERELYGWLAEWETEHLHFLAEIDREITEKAWNDNQFWPF
jgi:rubrerythrin